MKERITLSIIWHDHRKPIILSVSKSTLRKFATLSILLILLTLLFLLWIVLAHVENRRLLAKREEENRRLLAQQEYMLREKERFEAEILKEKDRLEAESQKLLQTREKLQALERIVFNIQSYLKERGITVEGAKGVGGGSAYKPSEEELLNSTLDIASRTYKILRETPLGYPVSGNITSTFGWRKDPFGSGYEFHTGLDIAAPHGAPVVATADGKVVFAGSFSDYGKTVIIKHASGYSTLYAHLSSVEVKEGQLVKAGQVIGRVGSTGRSTGPHLHYEVILMNKSVDPIRFLGRR